MKTKLLSTTFIGNCKLSNLRIPSMKYYSSKNFSITFLPIGKLSSIALEFTLWIDCKHFSEKKRKSSCTIHKNTSKL